MCAGAIGWSQLGRIVWGADDPKKGWRRYCDAVFHPRATVVRGVLAEECEELMMRNFSPLCAFRLWNIYKRGYFACRMPAGACLLR